MSKIIWFCVCIRNGLKISCNVLTNQSKPTGFFFFNQWGAKPNKTANRDLDYARFSRAWRRLQVFPDFWLVHCVFVFVVIGQIRLLWFYDSHSKNLHTDKNIVSHARLKIQHTTNSLVVDRDSLSCLARGNLHVTLIIVNQAIWATHGSYSSRGTVAFSGALARGLSVNSDTLGVVGTLRLRTCC